MKKIIISIVTLLAAALLFTLNAWAGEDSAQTNDEQAVTVQNPSDGKK